jgi:hypothetical protein
MPLSQHPWLADLRAFREPRGKALKVVESLCRRPTPPPKGSDIEWRPRLASDADIAKQLGMSVATVRAHITTVANWINGLEELEPRTRIYLWYWHREWEKRHEPAGR